MKTIYLCKNKFVILLLTLFCSTYSIEINAQISLEGLSLNELDLGPRSLKRNRSNKDNLKFLLGVQYGPEVVLSIPKFSLQYFFNISRKQKSAFYTGAEFSIWGFQTLWFTGGINGGFKYNIFSIDTNLSSFYHPKLFDNGNGKNDTHFHLSLNPKFGLYLFDFIWLKFGPSIFLFKNYSEDFLPLKESRRESGKERRFNFEIMFNIGF